MYRTTRERERERERERDSGSMIVCLTLMMPLCVCDRLLNLRARFEQFLHTCYRWRRTTCRSRSGVSELTMSEFDIWYAVAPSYGQAVTPLVGESPGRELTCNHVFVVLSRLPCSRRQHYRLEQSLLPFGQRDALKRSPEGMRHFLAMQHIRELEASGVPLRRPSAKPNDTDAELQESEDAMEAGMLLSRWRSSSWQLTSVVVCVCV